MEKSFFIFGTGNIGVLFYKSVSKFQNVNGFVDNDERKWGHTLLGLSIFSLDELIRDSSFIVIAVNNHIHSIISQLEKNGYRYKRDYITYKDFNLDFFYKNNIVHQAYLELFITNRCTLQCADCALMIPIFKEKSDKDIIEIKKDLDAYFHAVDFLYMLRILGGEPFLHKKLLALLNDLKRYFDKIGKIVIVTNGTVIPNEDVLKLLADDKFEISIGSYDVPIANVKRSMLISILNAYGIKYVLGTNGDWIDFFGNPEVKKNFNEAKIRSVFSRCLFGCRTIEKGKFYYCSIDCASKRLKLVDDEEDECIDLQGENVKEKLIKYDNGIIEKGYLSFCEYCNGGFDVNTKFIPPARQLRNVEK